MLNIVLSIKTLRFRKRKMFLRSLDDEFSTMKLKERRMLVPRAAFKVVLDSIKHTLCSVAQTHTNNTQQHTAQLSLS